METEEAFDTDDRWLCPDGACTGLLAPDGRCKVCGKQGDRPPAPEHAASSEPHQPEAPHPQTVDRQLSTVDASEWDDRQLCPDGSCTGLIGPDGRCKECGRTLE